MQISHGGYQGAGRDGGDSSSPHRGGALQPDRARYLSYEEAAPAAEVRRRVQMLRETLAVDSPVFQCVPGLVARSRAALLGPQGPGGGYRPMREEIGLRCPWLCATSTQRRLLTVPRSRPRASYPEAEHDLKLLLRFRSD
jgi:hypothetical protein